MVVLIKKCKPYNYAENEPVAGLNLWGLQRIGFDVVLDQNVKDYTAGNITKAEYLDNIQTTAKGGLTGGLGGGIIGAIRHFGMKADGLFLLQEAAETGFEAAPGIPVLLDPVDIAERAVKGTFKAAADEIN